MALNPEALSSLTRQVIRTPLDLAKLHWTSNDIANYLGVSQSRVARTWRETYLHTSKLPKLPDQIRIAEVRLSAKNTYIQCEILENSREFHFEINGTEMRSPRRYSLQTLLAAQVLADLNQNDSQQQISLENGQENSTHRLVLTTDLSLESKGFRVIHVNQEDWQGLLTYLVTCSHRTPAASLRDLHQDLILWSQSPEKEFMWQSKHEPSPSLPKPKRLLAVKSTQQVIADQIFEAIVNRIWNGSLAAGDRITEASLARELHTTRNQTRDAIRSLISTGLIDHDPIRGAVVPTPSIKDVIDIYAARKALGIEILKRAIQNIAFDIESVEQSFIELKEVANTGNSYDTGNADLHFQDVIAANSGMRNIPQMFATLAKQLRIYIAIMGITYVYSIFDMVEDDRVILTNLKEKDIDLAISSWEKKVNDSLIFMTNHVSKFR